MNLKQLGRVVRSRRNSRGYRQFAIELTDALGEPVTPATLSRLENGNHGRQLSALQERIVAHLGITEAEVTAVMLPTPPTAKSPDADRPAWDNEEDRWTDRGVPDWF